MAWHLTLCGIKGKIFPNVRQRQRRVTLEALRRARADAGLTISELAKRAGVSRDTVSNAERGLHSLQATTLHKVAHALGKAPSELLAEEERLTPKARSSSPEPTFDDALGDEQREDIFELALAAAKGQAEQDRKAENRTLASEGIRQPAYFKRHENEAVMELLKYPANELAGALIDTAAAREAERHDSILAKAIGVAAERWAAITTANLASPGPDRESVPGVYLVAADLENLLSIVMGDVEVWEKLSRVERSEIATVAAALGRVTEGYHDHKDEEQAAEQRRAMVRQWTREIATSA